MPAWATLALSAAGGVLTVAGLIRVMVWLLRPLLGVIHDLRDSVAGVRDVTATLSWYVALCERRFEVIEAQLGIRRPQTVNLDPEGPGRR